MAVGKDLDELQCRQEITRALVRIFSSQVELGN